MLMTTMGYNMLLTNMALLGIPVVSKKLNSFVLSGDINFESKKLEDYSSNNNNDDNSSSPIVSALTTTGNAVGTIATSYFKYKYLVYALLIGAVVTLFKD